MTSPATIDRGVVTAGGVNWITPAEKQLNEDAAQLARGRVLELGFGAGYAHEAMHANKAVTSIDVVEKYPERTTQERKLCACPVHKGSWQEYDCVTPYDTIFFDAHNGVVTPEDLASLRPCAHDTTTWIVYQLDDPKTNMGRYEVWDALPTSDD
jgi:protein-L-isoaspartate O-methyltransferase